MHRLFENYKKYHYLLVELIKKDIKLKYRSSALGLVWTLLEPLLTMIVLTVVFQGFFGREVANFPVYVLIGRLLYSFFSGGTRLALKSVRRNSGMIRKVYVPKYIYPLSSVLSSYLTFLISLVVLFFVAVTQQLRPTVHLFGAIVPLVTVLFLTIGAGLLLATLDVFFRDMEYLWGVILMLIMYVSAIFYDASRLLEAEEAWKAWLIKLNPLYGLIANFRNAVFGQPLDAFFAWYPALVSVVLLTVGVAAFYKNQDKFILYL